MPAENRLVSGRTKFIHLQGGGTHVTTSKRAKTTQTKKSSAPMRCFVREAIQRQVLEVVLPACNHDSSINPDMDLIRRLGSYIWNRGTTGDAVPLEETSSDATPYVLQDGEVPIYVPYTSRFVNVSIAGRPRPAALVNAEFVDAMKRIVRGGIEYQENSELFRVRTATMARYREFFEAEFERARQAALAAPWGRDGHEQAQRRWARLVRKLSQLDADDRVNEDATHLINSDAAGHLADFTDHTYQLLRRANIIPHHEMLEEDGIDPDWEHKYRFTYGDDSSSEGSDAPQPPDQDDDQQGPGPTNARGSAEPGDDAVTVAETAARQYTTTRQNLIAAQQNFRNRGAARLQRAVPLNQRLNDGEAGDDDITEFELQDYMNNQRLTRELIEAEEACRAAKAECVTQGANILNSDMTSMFPDMSEDDSAMTNGAQTQGRRDLLRPAMLDWQRNLPDFVDTVLAEQAEWTRRPAVDQWDAETVRDYDSVSMREWGRKRKRIDTVLADNQALHDQAVAQWVRDTNKRPMLFHQRDATRVFSRARE